MNSALMVVESRSAANPSAESLRQHWGFRPQQHQQNRVPTSSNHLALGGIEGRTVNGGEIGWHWPEPLAPNAVIIAQGTEQGVHHAWKPAKYPDGFQCMYRYGIVSDLL